MTFSCIRASSSQGTLPLSCQALIPIPSPPVLGTPHPPQVLSLATSRVFPVLAPGPPPNQGSLFLMGAKRRRRLFARPSLPYTGSSPPPPIQYSYQGPSPVTPFYIRVNPQLCPFLEGPQNQIPQISHRVLPSQSTCHTKILSPQVFSHVSPFLLCQALPLHDPSSLLELPRPSPETTSSLGPSHSRTDSPSTHPLPGSGLARGPRGAGARWGPQWGGRAASMAVVAAERRRPPVPARPARQAPRRGGQAGQAARWVTTAAAAAGGGERRERGSARGTRGKGKAGGRGRGGLTLAPPAPPRAATRPWGPRRPAPHPGGPPWSAEPRRAGRTELGSPHLPWQQPCHWPLLPKAQPIAAQNSCC